MRILFFTISLLLICFSNTHAQDKLFATINKDSVYIVYDTVKFKNDVLNIVFNDHKQKPVLESVQVIKKPIIGDARKFYYAVIVLDSSGTIKVAKWLEERNQNLYVIDKLNQNNRLQAYYFTCIGNQGCTPSVLSVNGELGWSCKESAVCTPDTSCRTIKSMLMD